MTSTRKERAGLASELLEQLKALHDEGLSFYCRDCQTGPVPAHELVAHLTHHVHVSGRSHSGMPWAVAGFLLEELLERVFERL